MSVLKIFENTPGRPAQGRQGSWRPSNGRQDPNVNFYFEFAKRSLARGRGPVAPPMGDRGLSPPQGRQGPPTLYKLWPPFYCHLSLKIQKKREG